MPVMTETVFMTCEPFVYAGVLNSSAVNGVDICDTCLIIGGVGGAALLRCSGCLKVSYCNATCQKKGWKDGHKYECRGLKDNKKSDNLPNPKKENSELEIKFDCLPRLLLRTLMKLQDGKDHFDVVKTEQGEIKRRFNDLVSHFEDIMKSEAKLQQAIVMIATVKLFLLMSPSKIAIPGDSELFEICGRILVNECSIVADGVILGSGVYLAGSIFNHSCDGMATREFEGTRMMVVSTKEIPEGYPIEKVTIKYLASGFDLKPLLTRQALLKRDYFFDCQCEKCTKGVFDKEMQSFICSQNGCKNVIDLENLWNPCGSCGYKLTDMERQDILNIITLAMLQQDTGNPLPWVSLLEQKNFSDGHWLLIDFRGKLFRLYLDNKNWEGAYDCGWKYLRGIKRYLDTNHKDVAWVSAKLALAALKLDKIEEAEELFNEAKEILKVAKLTNSPKYKNEIIPFENMLEDAKLRRSGIMAIRSVHLEAMPVMKKPGTVLMTCKPFVYAGILSSSAGNKGGVDICDACLTSGDGGSVLSRCSACRMVSYCNATCQKKGWKDGHKYECQGMKETSE